MRYPQRTSIERLPLGSSIEGKFIDLGPYFNSSPYTVTANMPLARVFEVFRYMGLRHLPVLDETSNVIGMVTREELTGEIYCHCHSLSYSSLFIMILCDYLSCVDSGMISWLCCCIEHKIHHLTHAFEFGGHEADH
jgi:hypothetical protein